MVSGNVLQDWDSLKGVIPSTLMGIQVHNSLLTQVVSGATMQKSRSSSSVVQHVSRKIWRTRSKSRGPPLRTSTWVPQGGCTWLETTSGHQVVLTGAPLQQLAELERRALRQAALARLRQLNLGVPVDIPDETAASAAHKPKRRAYLLKRKALTTGFLGKETDKEKESTGGMVFGVPLSQCADSSRRDGTLRRESGRGSRSSFSSLLDRGEDCAARNLLMEPKSNFFNRAFWVVGLFGWNPEENKCAEMANSIEKQLKTALFAKSFLHPRKSGSCESLASRDRLASSESELEVQDDICGGGLGRVPSIVACCFEHLRRHGLRTLGLFRVSTSKKRVRQLREDWDSGKESPLEPDTCPHDVATLLKEFFRDLPDPLLCRDLYHAFLQTQKIRNRRLQQEALQLLVLLLPSAHQDTLRALLTFLGEVASNAEDRQDGSGEYVSGNKMDSSNLATVFAPNILHCIKPGSAEKEMSAERAEERIDVINVVRSLLDQSNSMFGVESELRHEACLQLAATQPDKLDILLGRLLAISLRNQELIEGVQVSGGADSDSQGSPPSQRKVWSREECLHQTAAMGGPNVGMTLRQRERERGIREPRSNSKKRWREEQRQDSSSGSVSSTMTIITRLHGNQQTLHEDQQSSAYSSSKFTNRRSDSIDSASDSNDGYGQRRCSSSSEAPVITASLRLPLSLALDDPDIPYIEEGGIGQPSAPPRRRQRSISGSDSSIASQPITGTLSLSQKGSTFPAGYDSAVGSSATLSSPPRNLTPSSSSAGDGGLFSSPPSWASTPPTSPTSPTSTGDYEHFTARMSVPVKPVTTKQTPKDAPILQKVTITSTGEIHQKKLESYKREISYQTPSSFGQKSTSTMVELPKSHSASSMAGMISSQGQRRIDFMGSPPGKQERESKYTPSISNIGGAVMRSKTADFERLLLSSKTNDQPKVITKQEAPQPINDDKKKYTKRRYTDSRHQTRHIPDAETLDSTKTTEVSGTIVPTRTPLVYKRREIISSVQTKNK